MMKNLSLIIAQDSDSAKRFRQLGASSAQIRVAGSLKWVINASKIDDKAVADNSIYNKKADLRAEFGIATTVSSHISRYLACYRS